MIPGSRDEWTAWLAARGRETTAAVMFATRLPLVRAAADAGAGAAEKGLAPAVWALPLAGLVVGIIAALVFALAHRLGLTAWPAAALAVAAGMAVTGCLHEDGLADTIDGFGGGAAREQKLAIMRDSRIGTYGVCALAVSILIRVAALASLADPGAAAFALIAAHASARATLPVFMSFVAPARTDGLSALVGQPGREQALTAAAIGVAALLICLGVGPAIVALVALAIVTALVARLTVVQIGGQTGDVIGALEQACEIAVLLVAVG